MDIVLVRHAEREHKEAEERDALSSTGRQKTEETVKRLRLLQQRNAEALSAFTAILTSAYAAPRETATLLPQNASTPVVNLGCLAPREPGEKALLPQDLFAALKCKNELLPKNFFTKVDGEEVVAPGAVLAVVGHEPAISRLLCLMTGKDSRSLDRGEAVWITGKSEKDFISGKAELVYATRRENFADKLRDKIQTKMTVCTFLAGFTITALVEIIKEPEAIIKTSRVAAAISLTAALGLFVVAVYVYDELSMPPEFWNADTSRKAAGRTYFGHDARLNDNLYAHMVRAWKCLFTPGVFCTLIGFVSLLLFNLRYPHLVMPERAAVATLIGGCLASLAAAFLLYRRLRPRLATD